MKKNLVGKILCCVLALTFVIALVGCGSDDAEGNKTAETIKVQETEETGDYDKIDWPESELVKQIPKPESDIGEIFEESSTFFSVYVANTTLEDYKEYVKKCQKAGFTIDYHKGDTVFWAENKEGYKIEVDYEEETEETDVMCIIISAPKKETTTTKPKATKPKTTKPEVTKPKATKPKSSGVNSDFKETMDSYETFMNEYVDFMKKYNSSDDTLSMMDDYIDMLSKYTDWVQKIDDIDQDSLSSDDLAYYIEVTGRVTQKLLEVE